MKYQIKRKEVVLAEVEPNGWQDTQAMGVNIVEMDFSLLEPIEILQGDTVTVYGEEYFFPIAKADKTKDTSSLLWKYKLQFVHHYYKLSNYPYNARNKDNALLVPNFSYTGDLSAHFALFMQNLNQYEIDWTTGVIDSTDIRTISYADNNLLNVLNKWTEEFKIEYWIENKTIHLTKRTGVSGITLAYGKGKGLVSINQTVKDRRSIFTRLIAQGGNTNLPANYGYTNLQLPGGYIEDVTKINKYGKIVATKTFEDIIPERIGTISQIGDKFTFYDSSLNFDVAQYYLPGITPKIGFQTGQLAGLQFPITGYDNATKKFTIGINEDEKVVQLPNDSIKPAVGDKFSIFYISLPVEYVTDAQNRLLVAATEYYIAGSDENYSDEYTILCDKYHFQKNNIVPILGFTVNLTNPEPLLINVDKRVSGIKRNLQDVWDFELIVTDDIGITQTARSFLQQDRVYSLFATSSKQELTTNNQSFLGLLSGGNGYLYLAGVKVKAGFADMAQDAIHAFNADLALVANVAREVVSVDYVSGFAGTGHKLVGGVLEVDHIIARKSFETYELIRRKVTGIGGSFAVTDDMKILSVSGSNPYVCVFDTDNDTIPNYFRVDDIVRCQTYDSNRQKYYVARVTAITNSSFTLSVIEGTGIPTSGDVLFRFDNFSDVNRKGLIYMTNSDSGAPFIDFTYGFYTNPSTKTKVRLGNTAGIYDAEFGGFLNGYNLYADGAYLKNLYAKGQIIALPGSNVYNKTEVDGTIQAINNQIIALDGELAKYSNDGILNGITEKMPIKIAFDAAANEVEDLKTQAASLGVGSLDFNTAFINLQNYVTPLLSNLNSESAVDGIQLRDKFSYYGVQKSLLVKAIQAAQKTFSDTAALKAESIKTGLKNYTRFSDGIGGNPFANMWETLLQIVPGGGYMGGNAYWVKPTQNAIDLGTPGSAAIVNVEYGSNPLGYRPIIVSFYAKCTAFIPASHVITNHFQDHENKDIGSAGAGDFTGKKLSMNWQRFELHFNYVDWAIYTLGQPSQNVIYSKIKTSIGTELTDWQPHESDALVIIDQAKTAAQAASALYADAKAAAAETAAKAHADGVVSDEEAARIAADNAYLNAAKAYAEAEDAALQTTMQAYADGAVSESESAAIAAANAYADLKKIEAQAYADGKVSAEEARAIADATAKANAAKQNAIDFFKFRDGRREINDNPSYYNLTFPSQEVREFKNAWAIGLTSPDDYIGLITRVPYADYSGNRFGIAQTASANGRTWVRTGNLDSDTWSDWKEAENTASVNSKVDAAKAFAQAQDVYNLTVANAYADGKVTAEETARIAEAAAKLAEAKAHAAALDENLKFGAKNYVLQSSRIVTHSNGVYGELALYDLEPLTWGEEYILTYEKTSGTEPLFFLFNPLNGWDTSTLRLYPGIPFVLETGKIRNMLMVHSAPGGAAVSFKNMSLTKGNKIGDYLKHPSDDNPNENLINKSRIQGGYFDPNDGYSGVSWGPDMRDLTFYDCLPGDNFKFKIFGDIPLSAGGAGYIFFYDPAKNYIGSNLTHTKGGGAAINVISAPAGSRFYRYGIIDKDLKCKLEKSTFSTTYTESAIDLLSSVQAATQAASTAQSNALTALTELLSIVDDNLLHPSEKSAERQKWEVAYSDSQNFATQAIQFDILSEWAAYNNSFKSLSTYLNGGVTWIDPNIPSWLSNVNLSANTPIVGVTYRSNWKNYYDAEQTFLNAKAAKLKALADAANTNASNAQSTANAANTNASNAQNTANAANTNANNANNKIDNLKIGGPNLINKSKLVWGYIHEANGVDIIGWSSYRSDPNYYTCTPGETFILTVYAAMSTEPNAVYWYNSAGLFISKTGWLGSNSVASTLLTAPAGAVKYRYTVGHTDLKIKLERGNIKTDYSESEMDVAAKTAAKTTTFIGSSIVPPTANAAEDKWFDTTNKIWKKWNGTSWEALPDSFSGTSPYLTEALQQSTEFTGGLTLTSVIGVRNSGSVTAYMNGVNSNPIAFAAGVLAFGTGGETQKVAIKHDGSGKLANGNINWDTSGNISVTGIINATAGVFNNVNVQSGSIGGFQIGSHKLSSTPTAFGSTTFELNALAGEISFVGQFIDANQDSTRMGGNGIISNSSNTIFMPASDGRTTNASVVGLLRRGNDQDNGTGFDGRGVSAGIAGIDQTIPGSTNSRTYGGYFSSAFAGSLHTGRLLKSNTSTQNIPSGITTILFLSGASGVTMNFPALNVEEGRIIYFKNASGGTVYANRSGLENLVFNNLTTGTSSSITNRTISMWQRLNNQWMEMFYHTY